MEGRPVLANLDRSEEEVFLIKLPKELAEALHMLNY